MDGTVEPIDQAFNRLAGDLDQLVVESHKAAYVDDAEVVTSMRVQATHWLFWAQLATYATNIYRQWAVQANKVHAESKIRARKALVSAGERATDKLVEDIAEGDEEYQKALELRLKAQEVADHFKNVETALGQRVTMLKEMNQRQCREWWALQQKQEMSIPTETLDTPYSQRVQSPPRSRSGNSLEAHLQVLDRAMQERF